MINVLLRGHRIGSLLGIEIQIAFSLYIVMALMLLRSGSFTPYAILGVVLVPVIVFLHEMGHSLAAMQYGVRVRRIVLFILGGVAQLEGLIPGPVAEIVIALCGPAVNFALAAFCYVLSHALATGYTQSGFPLGPGSFFHVFFWANLFMGGFNLLPVFPLDGGRVATAVSVLAIGAERAIPLMKRVALVGVILLSAFGLFQLVTGNPHGLILMLIGWYIFLMGNQEMQARMYAQRYVSEGGRWTWRNEETPEPWSMGNWSSARGFQQPQAKQPGFFARWKRQREAQRQERQRREREALNAEVDAILDKVKQEGMDSLSPRERDLLRKASDQYRKQ